MFDRTLTERLEAAGRGEQMSARRNEAVQLQSILDNVRRILNDRRNCCQIRLDYGMPDLNDILGRGADSIYTLAEAVRVLIETFEPRLTNVEVRFRPEPGGSLGLGFQITAETTGDDEVGRVAFRSMLTSDRFMEVSD